MSSSLEESHANPRQPPAPPPRPSQRTPPLSCWMGCTQAPRVGSTYRGETDWGVPEWVGSIPLPPPRPETHPLSPAPSLLPMRGGAL